MVTYNIGFIADKLQEVTIYIFKTVIYQAVDLIFYAISICSIISVYWEAEYTLQGISVYSETEYSIITNRKVAPWP